MDLIKKLESADFSRVRRGYDIEEVDGFHSALIQDIAGLTRALRDAQKRAGAGGAGAPQRQQAARPANDGRLYDPDGAVQRILAVAQRTADESVSEAKQEATRMMSEAEARSTKINTEADQQRRLIVTEAAAEARRVAEATREPLVAEIKELEARRDALVADLEVLDTHVADERSRISASVGRIKEVIENPEAFKVSGTPDGTAPEGHYVPADIPEIDLGLDEPVESGAVEPEPEAVPDPEPEPTEQAGALLADESPAAVEASVTDLDDARNEVVQPAEAPLPEPEPVAEAAPATEPKAEDALFSEDGPVDAGPPTEAMLLDDLLGGSEEAAPEDPFLNELRKATEDEFGGADEDDAMAAFFDQDEEDGGKRKRRGRRG